MVREKEAGTEALTGTHVAGAGKAHLNIGSVTKRAEHTRLFGCPMEGTFNVEMPPRSRVLCKPFMQHGADSFWLVRLRKDGRDAYAYAVRWLGSKMPLNRMELLSRRPIAEHFKTGCLEITVYEQWGRKQIRAWQAALDDKTKWQGHSFWRPQRADSALVWKHLREGYDYSGKTVLDIGCNAGYFAFRAAHSGAVVTGLEKNAAILPVASTIQHHVEMTDVEFAHSSVHPGIQLSTAGYDYIFYLSVHHQRDPTYEQLEATLVMLADHSATLFVELINPPLSGHLTKDAVDAMVARCGGRELVRYQHQVRSMRSLYVVR